MGKLPQDMQRWQDVESRPAGSPAGGQERPVIVALQYYMPEVFPIPGAQEFDLFAIVTLPAVPGSTTTPAALQFTVPQSCIGIVRVVNAGLDDMTNATRVAFQMRLDGGRVLGPAGNFQIFPGVAARATASADVWVRLPQGVTVSVAIVNTDGAAYQVGYGYNGWWWPQALDEAWKRGQ